MCGWKWVCSIENCVLFGVFEGSCCLLYFTIIHKSLGSQHWWHQIHFKSSCDWPNSKLVLFSFLLSFVFFFLVLDISHFDSTFIFKSGIIIIHLAVGGKNVYSLLLFWFHLLVFLTYCFSFFFSSIIFTPLVAIFRPRHLILILNCAKKYHCRYQNRCTSCCHRQRHQFSSCHHL